MNNFWKGSPRTPEEDELMCAFLLWWFATREELFPVGKHWIDAVSDIARSVVHTLKLEKRSVTYRMMCW